MDTQSFQLDYQTYKVLGADALDYIHGQSTNDIKSLKDGQAIVNCLLNIKSEIESFFIFIRESESSIELLVPITNCEKFEKRFDQFLIMEEVELSKIEKKYYLNTNSDIGIELNYSSEDFTLSEYSQGPELKKEILACIFLFPFWDVTIFEEDMLTDTYLVESATNFDKGCYLGQETVSKIYNNRGPAKFPVLIESDKAIKGSLVSTQYNEKFFSLMKLKREERVEGKIYENGVIHILPFFDFSKQAKSLELYNEGIDLFNKDESTNAKNLLIDSIKLNPHFADAYEVLGVIFGRENAFEEAIQCMKELLEVDENSIMAHTNLSLFYMKQGKIEEAEVHKDKATVKTFESFGEVADQKRIMEEDLARREKMFLEVLEIDEDDTLANSGIAEILLSKEKYGQAVEKFEKVLNSDKKYSVAYLGLSKALIGEGNKSKAKEILIKGIDIASSNGDLMPANEMQAMLNKLS
jgi:tetratricopeptide (TPR) repeat protein